MPKAPGHRTALLQIQNRCMYLIEVRRLRPSITSLPTDRRQLQTGGPLLRVSQHSRATPGCYCPYKPALQWGRESAHPPPPHPPQPQVGQGELGLSCGDGTIGSPLERKGS